MQHQRFGLIVGHCGQGLGECRIIIGQPRGDEISLYASRNVSRLDRCIGLLQKFIHHLMPYTQELVSLGRDAVLSFPDGIVREHHEEAGMELGGSLGLELGLDMRPGRFLAYRLQGDRELGLRPFSVVRH